MEFLRAISVYRPVGEHRHFHMIAVLQAMSNVRGSPLGDESAEDAWAKLNEYYDVDGLNDMEGSSDDEDGPAWLAQYDAHVALLEKNKAARTRVVHGDDDGEFSLHPAAVFEPLMAPRRLDTSEDAAQSDGSARAKKPRDAQVVPPSSDDEGSASGSDNDAARGSTPATSGAPRRGTRKRAHADEDTSTETPAKDDAAGPSTRAGKRRRGAKADEDVAETPTRPIATRRQQRQLEDEEKKQSADDADDDDVSAPLPRSARATPLRRAVYSAGRSHAQSSPAPTPTRTTRARR